MSAHLYLVQDPAPIPKPHRSADIQRLRRYAKCLGLRLRKHGDLYDVAEYSEYAGGTTGAIARDLTLARADAYLSAEFMRCRTERREAERDAVSQVRHEYGAA